MKKWERLWMLSLVLALCLLLRGAAAADGEVVDSGSCDYGLSWSLDSAGTLTISGEGSMGDFSGASAPWSAHGAAINRVEVQDGVRSVGAFAFYTCTELTTVSLPRSVTALGYKAFCNCAKLDRLVYGGSEQEWDSVTVALGNEVLTRHVELYFDGREGVLGRDTETGPLLTLTSIPGYGDWGPFEGVVRQADGSAIDPTAYRVTLYLQLYEDGTAYIKPDNDHPTASLNEDGSFTLVYTSGGENDTRAPYLTLMLLPADCAPGNINDTRAQALDLVRVMRPEDGALTVTPQNRDRREDAVADDYWAPGIPSGLPAVSPDKIAFDVGFYTDGSYPGNGLSEKLIRGQLEAIRPYTNVVRFYKCSGDDYKAYTIANEMGFTVVGSAYLSKDKALNQTEMETLIELCNSGMCQVAVVGNEMLQGNVMSAKELVAALRFVREGITDQTIPVTTSEEINQLISAPSVRHACNFLFPNVHPYWGEASADEALGLFCSKLAVLAGAGDEKEITISESGWPSDGQVVGNAVAGETEAAQYYAALRAWSLETGTRVFHFAAADEPYKVSEEGLCGAHWGFMTTDYTLKDCYASLNPFGAGGVYGGNIAWAYHDGVLTLSLVENAEDGGMAELEEGGSFRDFPWYAFADSITSIEIEDGVVNVAACAFGGDEDEAAPYENVASLMIPDSLTCIGAQAFSGCPSLAAVIPATVLEFGAAAFEGCENVRFAFGEADFTLPADVLTVEAEALAGTAAASIFLPDGCQELGAAVFAGCTELRRVRIPESVSEIDELALEGLSGMLYVFGAPESEIARFIAESGLETVRFLPETEAALPVAESVS